MATKLKRDWNEETKRAMRLFIRTALNAKQGKAKIVDEKHSWLQGFYTAQYTSYIGAAKLLAATTFTWKRATETSFAW